MKIGNRVRCIDKEYSMYNHKGIIQDIELDVTSGVHYFKVLLEGDANPTYFTEAELEIVKQRGFEKVKDMPIDIPLPVRKTAKSAGYDIYVYHPDVYRLMKQGVPINEAWEQVKEQYYTHRGVVWVCRDEHSQSIILPTGIKAYMNDDEFLSMTIRSSSGIKKGIKQANPTSVIDADYYSNPDNDGHIMFAVRNEFIEFDAPMIHICQGIFMKYMITDNDEAGNERTGGIGSTDKENK